MTNYERIKATSENTMKFLKLVKENPNLPIIPLVNYEVVCEDYGNWVGSFGSSFVGEYTLFNDRFYDDREEFKEDYYNYYESDINKKFDYNPSLELPNNKPKYKIMKNNKKALNDVNKYLDEQANSFFKRAIIVYINTLD